jgi:hypothetical protein
VVEVVSALGGHEPDQRRRRPVVAGVSGGVDDVALLPVRGQEDQGVAVLDVVGKLLAGEPVRGIRVVCRLAMVVDVEELPQRGGSSGGGGGRQGPGSLQIVWAAAA